MKAFMKISLWLTCFLLHVTVCSAGSTGRCSLFGRHHVHTFDGVLYQFPGDCSYLLAGDCKHRSFTLLGDFSDGEKTGVTLFLGDVFELRLSVHGLLTQGEKMLSLPYASHSVFAGMELGYYKLWSEEFGFSVSIDNAANIALTMNKQHMNLTCGLCGNFNAEPADEYTAQEGFLTEDSYDFANSWAAKGAGEVCRRVSSPSQSCNSSEETSTILSACSTLQTSSLFLQCAHMVSVDAFLLLCQEEACVCDQGAGEDCYCPVLLEFARTCQAHGVTLRGWMKESQCFPKCPIGMQYNECTRACSTQCHSLNILEICKEECVDGCTCPAGKVLDGNRCVEVSQCSCVHMGRHFPPGSSISQDCNTCVCRHGSWECTNEGCPGECLVVGQAHFKTFDNKFFTFTGQCQFLLSRDCVDQTFSVVIENVQCADNQDAVCTRSVTVSIPSLEDMTVKLKHGGVVSVNGMDIQTPMFHGHLQIRRSVQSSVHLKFRDSLQLNWDGRGHVLLKLGPQWAGKTCGLCGNYNGNQGDDFLTDSGLIESGPQAFGHAWRINGDCKSTVKSETDPCAINPKRVRFAEESCSVMMSEIFSPCHFLVNPGPFHGICRYDVCACVDGEECLCSALALYAAACAAKGVMLSWRSPSLCEMDCPTGQVYEACGSVCDRSCLSLSGAESGCKHEHACEEGCFCPPGKYLSDSGECVTADRCTCLHDGQLYQPNDIYAEHNSVCYCESGAMRCSSAEMSSLVSDFFYDDDDVAPSRERRSAQCSPPLVRADCKKGEVGLECARNCQNLDLPCVSQACIRGCLCPPGTVRHGKDCILPKQCPCYHNYKPYASKQSIPVDCNTCVCENRKWWCTKKLCNGVCRTVGEGHYITFDGLNYLFPGLCRYVLVQDTCNGEEGLFRVLVENEACGIVGHRCAKAITVYYYGGMIVMQHGEVKMKRPVPLSAQVEIIRSGQFYTVLLGKHISLSWDRGTNLVVHISASYRGRVCGLCGNFDGNINNDLLSSNNQLEVDSSHFGNSWKVAPSCADVTRISPPCGSDISKLVMVEQSCRVLTGSLFKACNSQVYPEPYVAMCVEAACSCSSVGDCACFCDVIAAYAQACSEKSVSVTWRSNELCPMSCEELNPKLAATGEELCQWRYNTCGPACPITCQHPEPLHCAFTCVEGCHAYCPPGQLLDEVAMRCVDPSQCQVCVHEGQTISRGSQVILNHDDPNHCKICHCDSNTLSCEKCTSLTAISTPSPSLTTLPFPTQMPESTCDRAMDLAFLLDGSSALNEDEFEASKRFILRVVDRFRMGSAHTRATVLLYHSGVKTYDLQVQKWLFKKTVRDLHYAGGDAAFLDEAIKYLAYNIYDKNKRKHAGRIAIILTGSTNPRSLDRIVWMIQKNSITTLSVALGPGVDIAQINEITKANPDNRAYVLSSTRELNDRLLELTDYLCTLGLEPIVPTPPVRATTTTTQPPHVEPNGKQQSTQAPTTPRFASPTINPSTPTKDVTFIVEGSDSVSQENFNKTIVFLERVIIQLAEEDKFTRITIIQYSVTVTIEIQQWQLWKQKQLLMQRLRQIHLRGGNQTNTGLAISTTVKPPSKPTSAQLVFLVTENPPTDTVTRPPFLSNYTLVYPIGVGPKIRPIDLARYSYPQAPVIIKDYTQLSTIVQRVVNITETTFQPWVPTLRPVVVPTLSSLLPSEPCKKPVDVMFLLRAGEPFEDMKTFVRSFIKAADIGLNGFHIGVVQYGDTNTAELSWKDGQSTSRLLDLVDRIPNRKAAASALGSALRFAVRTAISAVGGGRVGTAKVVVMLVTDKSADDVQEAANEALAAGVSVFPVGIGRTYNHDELRLLDPSGQNTLHLTSMDQLLMLLTLDRSYTEKICRAAPPGVCVDDHGNERQVGESWLLEDGCHSVLCHPSGVVMMQNRKITCERIAQPTCRNHMPAVKVQEACSCHWECPCMCMGSSTNHVVRFDSLALRLDVDSSCSYTLLSVSRGVNEGIEVKLHRSPCQNSSNYNQVCMKAMEVTYGFGKLLLKDDMTVVIGPEKLSLPWRHDGLELVCYGGVMLQLKIEDSYILTFTPQSNEFTIALHGSATTGHSSGLCGACGEDAANVLTLRNGSPTTNQLAFISDWTAGEDGGACVFGQRVKCVPSVSMGCQALRSGIFNQCHAHIPVESFLAMCEEQACSESDVCEQISSYALMCRQSGVCVDWRDPHHCPFQCPTSMEYHSCRIGCVDDCRSLQRFSDDRSGNETSCTTTPTEGCFCPEGKVVHHGECVSPEACRQCVDSHGRTYKYLQTWVPRESPCLICVCLDQEHINCTARPCDDVKVPICGPCETPRAKRPSKCCEEYECVCDPMKCTAPEVPRCEDGQIAVLKNPGECQPTHECVCKKGSCSNLPPPECAAHRQLSVKKTTCCAAYECVCNCVNSTQTCQPGFTTLSLTDDCGCTEIKCLPDKVCVVDGIVHAVGSKWDQGCEKCSCTQLQDKYTSLHIAQCSPPACQRSCPLGSTYTPSNGECCGKCVPYSCVESGGDMKGDTLIGGNLRKVGEVWRSPHDKCVLNQCVRVNNEVLITATNVSCSALDMPSCPLGSELRCVTLDCCPHCYCEPMDVCVLNHTVIGAGEELMVDVCTHCQCLVENALIRKYKLSCARIECPKCQMGYTAQKEEGACCSRCVPTTCYTRKSDGTVLDLKVNTTTEDGCTLYTCGVNSNGELTMNVKVTSCRPFNRQKCLDEGGVVSQMGSTCCEMCTEPPCKRSVGTLNFVKVDDCQSEHQIELYYCEGNCPSKSIYSLERAAVEQECMCCSALGMEPISVSILCANGTRTQYTVQSVTSCDCLSKQCT